MDRSYRRRPSRTFRELWIVSFLTLAAIIFAILAIGRGPSRDTHEAILTALRAVDIDQASLQRDVLQSRAGLLRNYDPLVESVVNLHRTVVKLRTLFSEGGTDSDRQLDRLLQNLSGSIDKDEVSVEEFKTRNALLQNSLVIFNETLSDLHRSPYQEIQAALAGSNDLGNLMMRFNAQPINDIANRVRFRLDGLLGNDVAPVPELTTLVVHGRMILTTLPSVDETISLIQASNTPAQAQVLQRQYLETFGRISMRSAWSRILLGSIAILLCGKIAFLLYRLQAQTRRLTKRLEFEAMISSVRGGWGAESTAISTIMNKSLTAVADFFAADSFCFSLIDPRTGKAEMEFSSNQRFNVDRLEHQFRGRLRAWMAHEHPPDKRYFYQNLQRGSPCVLAANRGSSGAAIATDIGEHAVALLILQYDSSRKKPAYDDILFFQGAIAALAQLVDRKLSREARERLEERLEHSQRLEAVGTLAGGIAHEFNNILAAILGYGEMALQTMKKPSESRRYVTEIVSSGERAKHIIDQILSFSRKRERITKPFSLAEAISDMVPMLRVALADGAVLHTDLSGCKEAIVGNPIEIQQIVMNLCKNAAQASEIPANISVALSRITTNQNITLSHGELKSGSYAILSVADMGSGIADNILAHIFEPFFTTKSNAGGTGLGLSAVHGHVVSMGGAINIDSQLGRGTRFDLYFPVSNLSPIPVKKFYEPKSVPLGTGQSVLILEREPKLRAMYEEKIAALGYEPRGFSCVSALFDWLETPPNAADLALLDVTSARIELSRMNKQLIGSLPTIVLADQSESTWIDGRSLRSIGALRKPVSSVDLARAISTALRTDELDLDVTDLRSDAKDTMVPRPWRTERVSVHDL